MHLYLNVNSHSGLHDVLIFFSCRTVRFDLYGDVDYAICLLCVRVSARSGGECV